MAAGGQPNRVLSVAVLDDSTMVTLPAAFAPLPSGNVTMTVSTIDTGAPLDLRDFEVDAFTDAAVRFTGDTIKLP